MITWPLSPLPVHPDFDLSPCSNTYGLRYEGSFPSSFWYDTDFSKKKREKIRKLKKRFFSKKSQKSVSYQKKGGRGPVRRPPFGMTTTQDIRDLFS